MFAWFSVMLAELQIGSRILRSACGMSFSVVCADAAPARTSGTPSASACIRARNDRFIAIIASLGIHQWFIQEKSVADIPYADKSGISA